MIVKKRFVKLPPFIVEGQTVDPLTKDLYLCELSELLFGKHAVMEETTPLRNHLLLYCIKGGCHLKIASDDVVLAPEQFCIIPNGFTYKLISGPTEPTILFFCQFNGSKSKILEQEFTVVRDLIPSVNNRVANRKMLIDELFINLSRGYLYANMHYVNFTFTHLLATFVFASKTSEDIQVEDNPLIQKTIRFMEQNIDRKLSLQEIADETGFSVTYLSTIFRKETNYSPLSYFSHLKITRSCEYLDQTKLKVKQIAFLLGYSDPYYFSKDFQKKMGISPRAYRQRVKN
ncbi:helix-turn-helix domain-containing protein [Gaoshiqia sp. Z1-71]|uniref:helix-turn-helix domain-containing protein n=1 Tax=Gaoshiqia hydrogeniformans TaxID=3290090 RepID=UPI003BF90DF6